MATYYVDYEGGNDSNDGLSFANRKKLIGSVNANAGDTVRVMASPDATSLGINGTWTSSPFPAAVNISSSTNATPIEITTSSAHGCSVGDVVVVTSHSTNTAALGNWLVKTVPSSTRLTLQDGWGNDSVGNGVGGATGTVQKISYKAVVLASALNANVDNCEAAWTGANSATTTTDASNLKHNLASTQITLPGSPATSTLYAYKALSTTDYSGYQQLSFWIRTSGNVTVSTLKICLCSDNAGATPVDTFNIPAIGTNAVWVPLTIDKGSALGSSIQSVALYSDTATTGLGSLQIKLDNIVACKASSSADSLSHTSLIGKNSAGETWYAVQSIEGKVVRLNSTANSTPASSRGYYGTTETVTTYKRETIKTLTTGSAHFSLSRSGSAGSLINYEGGWDRTNMSTQSGETWYDGQAVNLTPTASTTVSYASLNKISFVRYLQFWTNQAWSYSTWSNCTFGFNGAAPIFSLGSSTGSVGNTFTSCFFVGSNDGFTLGGSCPGNTLTDCKFMLGQSGGRGVVSCHECIFTNPVVANHQAQGFQGCTDCLIINPTVVGQDGHSFQDCDRCLVVGGTSNSGNGVQIQGKQRLWFKGTTLNESNEVSATAWQDGRVFVHDCDNTAGNHKIYTDGGLITANTSTRHTASGYSWKMAPTSSNRQAVYPLWLTLGKFAVNANAEVTVSAWVNRDNTGITAKLVCRGRQIAGVDNDVTATASGSASSWEQLTINFTPTEAGVVQIEAWAYGGTTFAAYWDDLSISQA